MSEASNRNVRKYPVPPDSNDYIITFLTRQSDAVTRVYLTTQKVYLQEKGYNQNKRLSIGRLDYKLSPDWKEKGTRPTEMIPNEIYEVYFPKFRWCSETVLNQAKNDNMNEDEESSEEEFEQLFSDNDKVGPFLIIDETIKKLKLREILTPSFTESEIDRILDFVSYMVVNEDNAAIHFNGYAYEHALFESGRGVSDETLGRLFGQIDETKINAFMKKWNEHIIQEHEKTDNRKVYISVDGTNTSSQAGEIELVEYGASKIDDGNPIINMMLAVDMVSKLPILYDMYNGSINDMSECTFMLTQIIGMNYKAFGVVLDRGFFSIENIAYFDKHNLDFIIMAKGWKRFVRDDVLKVVSTFENREKAYIPRYGVYGTTTKCKLFGSERYIHVFYKPEMVAWEQNAHREKIENWENRLTKLKNTGTRGLEISKVYLRFFSIEYHEDKDDKDVVKKRTVVSFSRKEEEIDKELSLAGHFVIVTSEEMDAKTALIAYKSRDINEKLNAVSKTFLGNTSYRVSDKNHLRGKGFIVFLGMIFANLSFFHCSKKKPGKENLFNCTKFQRHLMNLKRSQLLSIQMAYTVNVFH